MIYIQRGENRNYPDRIDTWQFGKSNPPEWLSDQARVKFIDGNGNITLDYRSTNSGGVEILKGDGIEILVMLESRSSVVCKSFGRIFSLTKEQLDLLYKEEK